MDLVLEFHSSWPHRTFVAVEWTLKEMRRRRDRYMELGKFFGRALSGMKTPLLTQRVTWQKSPPKLTRSVSFEVAHFEDCSVATLENVEDLKPESPAKPFSGIRTSLALQASIAGLLANLSSNCATSKRGSQESPHDRAPRKRSVVCTVDRRIRFLADGEKAPR